jgi:hypothetical protein
MKILCLIFIVSSCLSKSEKIISENNRSISIINGGKKTIITKSHDPSCIKDYNLITKFPELKYLITNNIAYLTDGNTGIFIFDFSSNKVIKKFNYSQIFGINKLKCAEKYKIEKIENTFKHRR